MNGVPLIRRLLGSALLVLFGLLCSLLLFELGYRVLLIFSQPTKQFSDRPPFYFAAEGAPTLQDYPHSPLPEEDVFRMAVIGDSYSFAPYMQFTDAFPKVLERMLNLNGPNAKAEVINYGVPAYSTSHEVATAEQALSEGAKLLLLQVTLNDPEIKPYRPTGIKFFDTWGALKVTGWQRTVLDYWKSLELVITRVHNEKTRREYIQYFIDLFENPRTWRNFESSVRRIVEKSRVQNVPIAAAIFPLFGVPLNDKYPFQQCHAKAASLFRSLGVPVLDLFEPYRGMPIDRVQVIPHLDRHPNELGHRIAAEQIYLWLEQERLIPERLLIRRRFKGRTQLIKEEPYP